MSYLLDANLLSELTKPLPEPAVVDWFTRQDRQSLWVSVITFGEIERGIRLMDAGKRKQGLLAWLDRIRLEFGNQILPVSDGIMRSWAVIYSQPRYKGTMRDALDSLLAATASQNGLSIVTRNGADFPDEIPKVNPWKV